MKYSVASAEPDVRHGRSANRSLPWFMLSMLAFLLVPSPFGWFDGLPFDRAAEFSLATLAVATSWTADGQRQLQANGGWLARGCTALLMAGVVVKLLLGASGAYIGFPSCYRAGTSTSTACEASFGDPFVSGLTRIDPRIDFTADTWRADFLNNRRFDRDRRDDDWLPTVPFSATWRTVAASNTPARLVVHYRGAAELRIDGENTRFPEG